MPTPKLVQLTSWSYSRLTDYEKCPQKAKYKHIEKRKEPQNKAMTNGNTVHDEAQRFVLGTLKNLPESCLRFRAEFAVLRRVKASTEGSWAFTKEWKECESDDWNSAWVRIKIDAQYVVGTTGRVIDYKTGREYEDHKDQRKLYALGMFLKYPELKKVTAEHWYLDAGTEAKETFYRKDLSAMLDYWTERIATMMGDTRFPPRPGNECTWCFFRKANGGPCKY